MQITKTERRKQKSSSLHKFSQLFDIEYLTKQIKIKKYNKIYS